MAVELRVTHHRRLRQIWRSAGWPCRDMLEAELLAAGLLQRLYDADGRETLRVTDAGVALLAHTLQKNRAARDAHESLVQRVAQQMQRAGRVVWRGLSLRAPIGEGDAMRWAVALPDVYSIRHTTVEAYLEPVAHEIKVRRADLLADLRHEAKRVAYLALSGECWYVLREGIARPEEIPPECGVMIAGDAGLQVARPAPKRAMRMSFGLWMALARAAPMEPQAADEDAQPWLVEAPDAASGP
ncbi:MAG: hypothetical protein KF720_04130 [Rubrivivax sp.]|nr:hypothetical protein [Rubrivivax sp.]